MWCFGRTTASDEGNDDGAVWTTAGLDLAGEEAMCLQGFNIAALKDEFLQSYTPQDLMELAGNSFNGFVCCACITSLILAGPWDDLFGHDEEACGSQEPISEVLEEGSDSDVGSIVLTSPPELN